MLLDKSMKVIILVLSITSVATMIMLLFDNPDHHQTATIFFSFTDMEHLIFLVIFLAVLNMQTMFNSNIPSEYHPGKLMWIWCWARVISLSTCSASYLLL
jgi:hypothetical protein